MSFSRLIVDAIYFSSSHRDEATVRRSEIEDTKKYLVFSPFQPRYNAPTVFAVSSSFINSSFTPYFLMSDNFKKIQTNNNEQPKHSAYVRLLTEFSSTFQFQNTLCTIPCKHMMNKKDELKNLFLVKLFPTQTYFSRSVTTLSVSSENDFGGALSQIVKQFLNLNNFYFTYRSNNVSLSDANTGFPFEAFDDDYVIRRIDTVRLCQETTGGHDEKYTHFFDNISQSFLNQVESLCDSGMNVRRSGSFLEFRLLSQKKPSIIIKQQEDASSSPPPPKMMPHLKYLHLGNSLKFSLDFLTRLISMCPLLLELKTAHATTGIHGSKCPTTAYLRQRSVGFLESLDLGEAWITNGVATIQDDDFSFLTNLRSLKISRSAASVISDLDPSRVFCNLDRLETLDICERGTKGCTGEFLKSFYHHPQKNLRHFKYYALLDKDRQELPRFDTDYLRHPAFNNLRVLELYGTTGTALHDQKDLSPTCETPIVKSPELYIARGNDWTKELKSLESLTISGFFRKIFDFSFLVHLQTTLRYLDISPSDSDTERWVRNLFEMISFERMPNLETLILRRWMMYENTFQDLAKSCRQIKTLEFYGITVGYFDVPKCYNHLSRLTCCGESSGDQRLLENVVIDMLDGTRLKKDTFDIIFSSAFDSLKSLSLCYAVSLFDLNKVREMKRLAHLHLKGCHNLTEENLMECLVDDNNDSEGSLSSLKTLKVEDCLKLKNLANSLEELKMKKDIKRMASV